MSEIVSTCGRCGETKPISEFYEVGPKDCRACHLAACRDALSQDANYRTLRSSVRSEFMRQVERIVSGWIDGKRGSQ